MVLGSLPKCNKRYKLDVFHGLDGFSVWHWLYTSMRVSWGASGVTPGDMEKNFMKNRFAAKANKGFLEIAIGLLAICLSGVFFGGFASADDAAGDVDGSISTTTSELDTQEQCTWFVTGVPATVVMIIDPDETITKYDGTDMDLTNETPDALTAYTSGNEGTGNADGNTECTFYNAKTGITISKSISAYAFTARKVGADSDEGGMGFDLSSGNALGINYTEGNCWTNADADEETSGWTKGNASLYGVSNNSASVLSLAFASTQQVNTESTSERCTLSGSYSVTVPSGKQPSFPGSNYVFSGPTISTDIELPNS
jgi:hypothetical protein